MTRKDYEVIAQGIRQYRDHILEMMEMPENKPNADLNRLRLQGADYTISYLVEALRAENPRFDQSKFYQAVGMN